MRSRGASRFALGIGGHEAERCAATHSAERDEAERCAATHSAERDEAERWAATYSAERDLRLLGIGGGLRLLGIGGGLRLLGIGGDLRLLGGRGETPLSFFSPLPPCPPAPLLSFSGVAYA